MAAPYGYASPFGIRNSINEEPKSSLSMPVSFGEVSYDTNSTDPLMKRSRIFIGNLQPGNNTRDEVIELCRNYGNVIAATLFKGFAFVQYSRCQDADEAVVKLHNQMLKGTRIDVRLAINPKGLEKASDQIVKKRKADELAYTEEINQVNDRNRRIATVDLTKNTDFADTGMADTLICGGCRFVTCDFEVWRQHRLVACAKPKDSHEPEVLKCASCEQRFQTAWGLVTHLTDFHRMMLFKPETLAPNQPQLVGDAQSLASVSQQSVVSSEPQENGQEAQQEVLANP
ncbi:unnamed protein product, partial [Mesorhabditis belari]|uniref:RRM domain-containing protein n=1 Tax=Mesorhabditis belari TaxID=2138241 RepID=A0AAF3JAL7_9BILA